MIPTPTLAVACFVAALFIAAFITLIILLARLHRQWFVLSDAAESGHPRRMCETDDAPGPARVLPPQNRVGARELRKQQRGKR